MLDIKCQFCVEKRLRICSVLHTNVEIIQTVLSIPFNNPLHGFEVEAMAFMTIL